ncbi:hypothetical protein QZH41_003953 [Actinostola sp. cb2023]|nr:hypothetical protein QZH41_003953 [Actinostola sp. cb2023]
MKLSQAEDRNTSCEQELARYEDRVKEHTVIIEKYQQLVRTLENEAQENKNEAESLHKELEEAYDNITCINSENTDAKNKMISLNEEAILHTEEKTAIEIEVNVTKQQLEMANEGRIRAESAQVKAQDELKNLQCMMEQEVAALKFQLSSETIKFETEKKVFSEQSQESARYKERSIELEETITDLESKLKERSDEWQTETRKYVNEIKRLRSQVQLLKNALEGNKQNAMKLENNFLLTTKQLEEEQSRQKDIKQKMHNIEVNKVEIEKELQDKIHEMNDDMKDLKSKIVSLTRRDMWWKHILEYGQLVRNSKLKRVCNYCLAKDQRLKPQQAPKRRNDTEDDFDETMSDIFVTSPRKEHYRQDESASVETNEYLSFAKSPLVSFGNSSAAAERLGSPDGEGYESIIFGLAYKESESVPYEAIETLYPLARFSSNVTPVEGEWKTCSHGVYVLVFDNSFSRYIKMYPERKIDIYLSFVWFSHVLKHFNAAQINLCKVFRYGKVFQSCFQGVFTDLRRT